MEKISRGEIGPRDVQFNWTDTERGFMHLFTLPFDLEGVPNVSSKASARWDYKTNTVVIRTLDGFYLPLSNIQKPTLVQNQEIYERAREEWRKWNEERANPQQEMATG